MTTVRSRSIALLEKGKATIEKRGRWIKREFAQDAKGNSVLSKSNLAVKWDLIGAVIKYSNNGSNVRRYTIQCLEVCADDPCGPAFWQDVKRRKKKDVLELIDKTILFISSQRYRKYPWRRLVKKS